MTTANASCPLNLSPATIAAWRDGALSGDEAARIAAHISGCVACRREIARYESLDDTLRRQPVPQSDGRLWRDVRAGMTSRHRSRMNSQAARRILGVGGALAAVLLLALGFAQLFHAQGMATIHSHPTATTFHGTPTPLPTAAPASPAVPGTPLTTQAASLPAQGITFGEQSGDILTFGVAATDGATAYACYSTTDSTGSLLRMYRTSDRAVHWTLLTQFLLPDIQTSDCEVQVDTLDASRVFVNVLGQNIKTFQEISLNVLTENGGASWTNILNDSANNGYSYWDVTASGGHVYALRQRNGNNLQASHIIHLSASDDHMKTWRSIDTNLIAVNADQAVSQFWVRPDGRLLAEVTTLQKNASGIAMPADQSLWTSADGGAHWQRFVVPLPARTALVLASGFLVQFPVNANVWHVCASYSTARDQRSLDGIVCTFDGGQTWSVRPALCPAAPCSPSSLALMGDMSGWALTADDSILLIASDNAPGNAARLSFYSLSAQSSQWQYLGPVSSGGAFLYAPSSSGGVIWLYAGGTYQAHLSGSIGGHLGSLPNVLLETATYP